VFLFAVHFFLVWFGLVWFFLFLMDVSQANERNILQSCIPQWRSADFKAFGQQQLSPPPPPPPRGGGVSSSYSGGGGECKLEIMDDTMILCELMDFDPLPGEAWIMANNQTDLSAPFMNFSQSLFASAAAPSCPPCGTVINSTYLLEALDEQSPAILAQQGEPQAVLCSETRLPSPEFTDSYFSPRGSDIASFLSSQMPRTDVKTEKTVPEAKLCRVLTRPAKGCADQGPDGRHCFETESFIDSKSTLVQCPEQGTDGNPGRRRGPALTPEGRMRRSGRTDSAPFSLRDRLLQAVRYIGRCRPDVLAQVWMPVTHTNKTTCLTTRDQPYVLELKNHQLWSFRSVSEKYDFPTAADKESAAGGGGGGFSCDLPGRVFLSQAPEWTPNVQLYSSNEYVRVQEAQRYDVRGTAAVPVLDPVSRSSLAVIELVSKSEKVEYRPEIDVVRKALQVGIHLDLNHPRLTPFVLALNSSTHREQTSEV